MAGTGRGKDLPAWFKEMEKDLECPVCLNTFLDGPIYVCVNQHGICETCRTKLINQEKDCPVCNGSLTVKRNLMVEKILDKLPKTKCAFPECSFKRAEHQVVLDHQEDCCHRKAPCGWCGESVAMSNLTNHLQMQHDVKVGQFPIHSCEKWTCEMLLTCRPCADDGCAARSFSQCPHQALNGVTIYLNTYKQYIEFVMFWVSYNGPKKDHNKYNYNIEVVDEQGRTALSCTKFCVPCDTSFDEVKEDDLGVTINKKLAQKANMEGFPANDPQIKLNVRFFLSS